MAVVRVLIIDDSAAVRRLLTDILTADPDIEVAGQAATASVALTKIEECAPDVVTLDVEMPEVSGLELLTDIRKRHPRLPVIMFSSLTQRAATTTLEALGRGATDYVTKPAMTGDRAASVAHVKEQLLPKVKALGAGWRRAPSLTAVSRPLSKALPPARTPIDAVLVGASTGGPNALATLFAALPRDLAVPLLVVQHMPPLFTRLLAERLTAAGGPPCREATAGDVLEAGRAWIAPGDYHMRLEKAGMQIRISLDQGPPEHSCRPAVDALFRSAAEIYGGRVLAVVLTGMGQDGLKGAQLLHDRGAQILVQDEASSVVWGMPGFIARAGLADGVLPLAEVAGAITSRVGSSAARSAGAVGAVAWT